MSLKINKQSNNFSLSITLDESERPKRLSLSIVSVLTPESVETTSERSPQEIPGETISKPKLKLSLFTSNDSPSSYDRPRSNLTAFRREFFAKRAAESPKITPTSESVRTTLWKLSPETTTNEPQKTFQADDDLPDWSFPITKSRAVHFQTEEDRVLMRSLFCKRKEDFEELVGINFSGLEVDEVNGSQLGVFLQKKDYEIVERLKTDGANSYCFTIRKNNSENMQFLKVLRPSEWNAPSLKNFIYSEDRGDGWLEKNKEGLLHTLTPDEIIGVDKDGQIISECHKNDLMLASISPLIKAVNLKTLLTNEKLKEKEKQKLVTQILEAVNSFKQKNMTHRDLTPQNILINPNTLEVWVIDFGHGTTEACRPLDGVYAAPESSSKMDEFTLGLILLEICTGIKPFHTLPQTSDTSSNEVETQKTYKDAILEGQIPTSTISTALRPMIPLIEGLLKVNHEERWTVSETLERWSKIISSEES